MGQMGNSIDTISNATTASTPNAAANNNTAAENIIKGAELVCEHYDLEINVATRLGGIPVQGVKIELKQGFNLEPGKSEILYSTGEKIVFSSLTDKELKLEMTYSNKKEHLKPEIVTITLTNLIRSCVANKYAKAHFEHSIKKIIDVKNLPAGEHEDFSDDYWVDATIYTSSPPQDSQNTEPLVESSLEVEKQTDGGQPTRVIIHLNVSLATFSLAVPYLNQCAGFVKVEPKTGDNKTGYALQWGTGYPKTNPWSGECLCAPTTATMILMYYGISTTRTAVAISTGSNINAIDAGVLNRAGLMARFDLVEFDPDTDDKDDPQFRPWEDSGAVHRVVKAVFEKEAGAEFSIEDISIGSGFKRQMRNLFKIFVECDPVYASIIGSHILVVRGAVVSSKGTDALWAICNDPYGTLAGQESDYSQHNHFDSWYSGAHIQYNSATRKERNKVNVDSDNEPNSRKGLNVYYNDKTHSRSGTSFSYFFFTRASKFHYRNKADQDKEKHNKKIFASGRLVKGELQ